MFDLLFAALALYALGLSLRGRQGVAAGCAAAGLGLLAWSSAAGVLGRGAEAYGVNGAWMLVLFGPGAVPGAALAVPGSALCAQHPLALRGLQGALFALGAARVRRSALRHAHESDAADRCRRTALAFVWPALLAVLPAGLFTLATLTEPF